METMIMDRSQYGTGITSLLICICLILASCRSETMDIEVKALILLPDLVSSTDSVRIFAPGLVSTALYERDIAISANDDEIIYTLSDYRQRKRALVSIRKDDQGWQAPEVLPFSGRYQDIEPFWDDSGDRLYFASDRPIFGDTSRSDYNIWYSDRLPDGWSEPTPLDAVINSPSDEYYPSLSTSGNLYFTATREGGHGLEDIYVSMYTDSGYLSPVPLPETINSAAYEFNAFVDPRERFLLFSSFGREDGQGGGDLYVSERNAEGRWQMARNLGKRINSAGLDYCPFVDRSERRLYFTSERPTAMPERIDSPKVLDRWANSPDNGLGNIYYIDLSALGLNGL